MKQDSGRPPALCHSRGGLFWDRQPHLSPLQGIMRVKNATDAVGVVLRELKGQSSLGGFRLLVAVDGVNALWGKTTLKREDKSLVGKLGFSTLVSLTPALAHGGRDLAL